MYQPNTEHALTIFHYRYHGLCKENVSCTALIAISKCYVLKITRAKLHKVECNYQLYNISLTELNSCKYLGVTIQSDLKRSQHIHQITVKANCTLSLIKRNLRSASKSLRETTYFTLVWSQLE